MLRCLIEQIGGSVSDSESLPTSDLNSYDILFVEPEHLTVPGVDLRSTSARIIVVSTWPQRTDVEKKAFAMNAELITRPVSMHSLIELFDRRTTEAEEEAVEFDRKDLKILIVEDNLVNQKIASAMLSKAGLTCDIAKDGIEALEKHSQDSWDIIFMDCHMPRMDGFKASEEIRRREKNSGRHDTIIALTANVLQGDKDRCLEAGMDAYLPKPLDRAELYQVIKNHIGEDQAIDHK